MRKFEPLVVFVTLLITTSLIRADTRNASILTEADYEFERLSRQEGPALSSALGAEVKWESYNTWRCFPASAIDLGCNDIDYKGDWRKVPRIVATAGNQWFEYDLDPSIRRDCKFALNEWRQSLEHSIEICLFAAHLQPLKDGGSLWVLSRIKSAGGYWEE